MMSLLVCGHPGGVLDYATTLSHALPQADVTKLPPADTAAAALQGRHVILQYSGYGFEKHGAPVWLPGRLRELKRTAASVGVYFHELYATSTRPWRSAFWLAPVQQRIARQLAQLSDFWMTNRHDSAHWIAERSPPRKHRVLPVFSNVGELASEPSGTRDRAAIVFGGPALRTQFYLAHGEALAAWARRADVAVHDIGPPLQDAHALAAQRATGAQVHGPLEAAEVSARMAAALFGVVVYPVGWLSKSSVFAAYCAHGLCPLVFAPDSACADGLDAGTHYVAGLPPPPFEVERFEAIGRHAWQWYQPHRIAAHADCVREFTHTG